MKRSLLALGLALVLGVVAPVPARAGTSNRWVFDSRPAGLPGTTVPARTLDWARAYLDSGADDATFTATIRLGDVPDDATDAQVRLTIGTWSPDGCTPEWSVTVPTLAPGGPVTRDGRTLEVAATLPPAAYAARCGSVTLLDGTTVLDELDESFASPGIVDPSATGHIDQVRGLRVTPRQWSTIWLLVRNVGADARGFRINGHGAHVDVRKTRVRHDVASGERLWVPVKVSLDGRRAGQVRLEARPFGNLLGPDADPRTVTVRPRR